MTSKPRHKLTEKQRRFCEEYVIDNNAVKALIRAGYSEKTADKAAYQLLGKTWVKAYVSKLKRDLQKKTAITAERVIAEYAKIAFADIKDIFDENGNIKNISDLQNIITASISEVSTNSTKIGDEEILIRRAYKFHSKVAALDALGKHLGIFEKDNKQKGEAINTVIVLPSNNRDDKPAETNES